MLTYDIQLADGLRNSRKCDARYSLCLDSEPRNETLSIWQSPRHNREQEGSVEEKHKLSAKGWMRDELLCRSL